MSPCPKHNDIAQKFRRPHTRLPGSIPIQRPVFNGLMSFARFVGRQLDLLIRRVGACRISVSRTQESNTLWKQNYTTRECSHSKTGTKTFQLTSILKPISKTSWHGRRFRRLLATAHVSECSVSIITTLALSSRITPTNMSRRKKHNRSERMQIRECPDISANGIISTFANPRNIDLRNTDDLMNWLIFGDTKQKFFTSTNDF